MARPGRSLGSFLGIVLTWLPSAPAHRSSYEVKRRGTESNFCDLPSSLLHFLAGRNSGKTKAQEAGAVIGSAPAAIGRPAELGAAEPAAAAVHPTRLLQHPLRHADM